jgi:hypothetical protein
VRTRRRSRSTSPAAAWCARARRSRWTHPDPMDRPPMSIGSAAVVVMRRADLAGSTRMSARPCPLAATAMFPPIRNASHRGRRASFSTATPHPAADTGSSSWTVSTRWRSTASRWSTGSTRSSPVNHSTTFTASSVKQRDRREGLNLVGPSVNRYNCRRRCRARPCSRNHSELVHRISLTAPTGNSALILGGSARQPCDIGPGEEFEGRLPFR